MEIIATVVITLGFVLLFAGMFLLFRAVQELRNTQQMMVQVTEFINQMGQSIVDAQSCIETKKRALGLGVDNEEIQ